jgi:hypothetical protein
MGAYDDVFYTALDWLGYRSGGSQFSVLVAESGELFCELCEWLGGVCGFTGCELDS